jgi:hypothetical protein
VFRDIAFIIVTILVLLLGEATCSNTPASTTTSTLFSVLKVVPSSENVRLMYNHIPALSAYRNQRIPSHQASMDEKIQWWKTFQMDIISGYSYSGVVDFWGFDEVDLEEILTFGDSKTPQVTVLSGNLDTGSFLNKMKSYQYTEETYLGYTVLFGIPIVNIGSRSDISDKLPRAYGIINGIKVNGNTDNLILLVPQEMENDVISAKNTIEAALKSYHENTTLGFKKDVITTLTNSLGEVGAAYIMNAPAFEKMYQGLNVENKNVIQSYIAPVKLGKYDAFAITLRKNENDTMLTFSLAYENNTEAKSNIDALQARITESRSMVFPQKPLAGPDGLWDVLEVKADSQFLRATVKLNESNGKTAISMVTMIYTPEYWFLYPN